MAAVDVSRVVALTNKAELLVSRGHWARAGDIYAEAVAAAQALHQTDCLIVAYLQAARANALLGHAQTAGAETRTKELMRSAFLELLPAAMASLERRRAAGTLMAGACRPYEVAWCAAKSVHAVELAANMPHAEGHVPGTAEELSAASAHVGHDAYVVAAALALDCCTLAKNVAAARTLNLPEANAERSEANACVLVCDMPRSVVSCRRARTSSFRCIASAFARIRPPPRMPATAATACVRRLTFTRRSPRLQTAPPPCAPRGRLPCAQASPALGAPCSSRRRSGTRSSA